MQINVKSQMKKDYEEKLSFIDAFMKGISGLAADKSRFLSIFKEDDAFRELTERFSRARLTNYVESGFQKVMGKLVNAEIEYNEDAFKDKPNLKNALEDMDGNGLTLHQFTAKAMSQAMTQGFFPCLVDYPVNNVTTLAESEKILPVFNLIDQNSFYYSTKSKNSFTPYSSFVFKTEESDGVTLDEAKGEIVENIKTFYNVYHLKEDKLVLSRFLDEKGSGLSHVETIESQNNFIPMSFLNFNKEISKEELMTVPPLYDLAHNNGALFRNQSAQTEILRVARFPIFAATGVKNKAPEKLSPNSWLSSEESDAKFYVVEPKGNAAESGKNDIEIAKNEIENLITGFFQEQVTSNGTATDALISESNRMTRIEYFAKKTSLFLNDIFNIAYSFSKDNPERVDFGFNIKLNDTSFISNDNKQFILKLNQIGGLSKESLLKLAKKYKVLGEEFDIDKEIELIKSESEEPSEDFVNNV